jgi:hypothetical protein
MLHHWLDSGLRLEAQFEILLIDSAEYFNIFSIYFCFFNDVQLLFNGEILFCKAALMEFKIILLLGSHYRCIHFLIRRMNHYASKVDYLSPSKLTFLK